MSASHDAPKPADTASPDTASPSTASSETASPETASADHPHDFEVQKELHQQIRNDPDYDDWEYGTEPLPHEAWLKRESSQA